MKRINLLFDCEELCDDLSHIFGEFDKKLLKKLRSRYNYIFVNDEYIIVGFEKKNGNYSKNFYPNFFRDSFTWRVDDILDWMNLGNKLNSDQTNYLSNLVK
jgi:hypothetical protein